MYIMIIAVMTMAAALFKADEMKHDKETTVYDYRNDPEVLNDFIK